MYSTFGSLVVYTFEKCVAVLRSTTFSHASIVWSIGRAKSANERAERICPNQNGNHSLRVAAARARAFAVLLAPVAALVLASRAKLASTCAAQCLSTLARVL